MANYTLTAAINGANTPIGVTPAYALTGSGYPGRLSCESEIMYVTGGDGTTEISVLRGQDGTDAVAHTSGTTIADANLGTGGGVQTLAAVLAVGNDTGGLPIVNDTTGAGDAFLDVLAVSDTSATVTSGADVGGLTAEVGSSSDGTSAYAYIIVAGGIGAYVQVQSESGVDDVVIRDATSVGAAGQFMGSDGAGHATWQTPTVRHAAEVPSGAPGVGELPIAFDSTAVTGGLYFWDGAAWVKGSVIP